MKFKSIPKVKIIKSKPPPKIKKSLKIKKSNSVHKRAELRKLRSKFGGSNKEILNQSLILLIQDLLPLAVENYSSDSRQSNAYAVTNIISEIRGIISQLESSLDSNSIIAEVNKAVASSLRMLITSMSTHLVAIKQGLPLKIDDSGTRKEIQLVLDSTLKEFQKIMQETIQDIDRRVSEAVNLVVKSKVGRKK